MTTWREIAETWENNLKGKSSEWMPVGSGTLADALLDAKDEIAQLETELAGMKLMEAEAEQFAEGMELVPEGKIARLEAKNKQLREGLQLWIDFAANSLEFRMFLASDERYHKVFRLTSNALGVE